MHISPLFSSFVIDGSLDVDNDALKKYCLETREKDPGRQISNQGGWQSNLIMKVENDFRELYEKVLETLISANKELGFDGPTPRMQSFWMNINGEGNYNEVHDHPGCFYAGVYYVDAEEDQGEIVFYNPISFFSNYTVMNNVKEFTPYNAVNWRFKPKTGRLLIFPSYLNHFVRRNMSNKERISIAFNFGMDWSTAPKRVEGY